jgi:APA family basic amino acid/polyamine antiporter
MIVQEARELHAQAIVAPLPPRSGATLFGKTLETVLAERPCRVIIQSDPAKAPPHRPAVVATPA